MAAGRILLERREQVARVTLSVRAAKAIVAEALRPAAERDAGRCERLVDRCRESEDAVEGRAAFADKRPPVFRGR